MSIRNPRCSLIWLSQRRIAALAVVALFALSGSPAYADITPKPSMTFEFAGAGETAAIACIDILVCSDADCADARSFRQVYGQTLPEVDCSDSQCKSHGVPGPYNQLVVEFEDATRKSNVFRQRGFDGVYDVHVAEDDLAVAWTPSISFFGWYDYYCFPIVLVVVILIESWVATVYFSVVRTRRPALIWVAAVNAFTLFIVWFPLRLFGLETPIYLVVSQTFAIGAEAAILNRVWRRSHDATRAHVVAVSVIMNVVSFIAGYALFYGSGLF